MRKRGKVVVEFRIIARFPSYCGRRSYPLFYGLPELLDDLSLSHLVEAPIRFSSIVILFLFLSLSFAPLSPPLPPRHAVSRRIEEGASGSEPPLSLVSPSSSSRFVLLC